MNREEFFIVEWFQIQYSQCQHLVACRYSYTGVWIEEGTKRLFKISRSSVTRASSRFSRVISVVRSFHAPEPGNAVVPRARSSVCHL